jgi:HK97 family phage prohead protease
MKTFSGKLQRKGEKFEFVASDETLDRSNEVLKIESWDLTNFMMNPVLLVNHDYKVENIVGLAKDLRIEDRQLKFTPEFHAITELAKNVQDMVREGVLNTVSVGFIPHGPAGDGELPRNELLEISFVPVPANPGAQRLKAALEAEVKSEQKAEVEKWVKQNEVLDAIRLEFTKSSEDEAKAWATEHKYKIVKSEVVSDVVVLHLVNPDVKCEGEEKEIQIDTDIKLFACRLAERTATEESKNLEVLELEVKDLLNENAELKEGRVLSGKNRKIINDALSSVKAAADVLESVLSATESDPSKDIGGNGRTPEVEHDASEPKKVPSRVVRALQRINKESNTLLAEIKE